MSSVNSVRIPGLATGMDTDQMIKDMLTGEQSKIDKVFQNQQMVKWQQETYRDITKNVKGFYDKYFSVTSKDYILGSKSFNTITVNSSNNSVITATGSSSASNINYNFDVKRLATSKTMSASSASNGVTIKKDSTLEELGLLVDGATFKISTGEGKESKVITINKDDKVSDLINKINESFPGEVKASFSDMTGKLTISSNTTGDSSTLKIIDVEKDADGNYVNKDTSDSLSFLKMSETEGKNAEVIVMDSAGKVIKELNESKNTFNIDGITYNLNGVGQASLTSTQDVTPVVEKLESFINDYNKIMDDIYDLVTQKKSNGYPPLTEAQKKEMTEEEIKNWDKKSKEGMLRNDSELRAFMDDMKSAMLGPFESLGKSLSDIGITSVDNYNKPGQIKLDVDKFTKVLQENGDLAEKITTGVFDKVKTNMYKYVGSSTSIFAKKAGIEKTSTDLNNLYSEQIRKQEEQIKKLTSKMKTKEQQLYSKFARLEATMSKLNSQMNYFVNQ
ncbi:flagellar filament capping protein FliD [Clostridium sp. NSJ-6]|uniref:Flagellar hook-associated protein 2 n=1 Tax=Clostridium hominis TaxID=2763036 RepID=A0ABR7DHP7_9CLOT|nr:flagellar filament capping protein FliD [Clostridium hominis]MBC5630939.1 flagellar filament capping protein FliD [Clostridium hominis]MDU2673729.1 flagellar filament capping protein FliD [Clostridium sp.]